MSRVIHFDLSADNPERAAEFYRGVFNWKVNKWEGPEDYWLIQTGTEEEPGADGNRRPLPSSGQQAAGRSMSIDRLR